MFRGILAIALVAVFGAHPGVAAAMGPEMMIYSGILPQGVNAGDGYYDITFSLYPSEEGGTPLWSETQSVYVYRGAFAVYLGAVKPLDLAFDVPYWVGVTAGDREDLWPLMAGHAPRPAPVVEAVADVTPLAVAADEVGSANIKEADNVTGQNTNAGFGVKTGHIANGAVTTAKIGANAVTSARIKDATIATADIADGAVTDTKVTGPISTVKLSVGTAAGTVAAGNHGHNFNSSFVNVTGDTMTGALNLPANGLVVGTNQVVVTGGKLGIGTAAPGAPLHVKTGTSDIVGVLESSDPVAALLLRDPNGTVALRTNSGNMMLGVGGYELAYEKMRITPAGNVGIGTPSPGQKLTVAGTIESTSGGVKFPDGTVQTTAYACAGNDGNDVMVKVGPLCVDKYEASVWSTGSGGTRYGASSDNYPCDDNGNDCSSTHPIYARSVAGVAPSVYLTWFQAQQACAMSGKRLLTNAEWQMAAAGTPDPGFDDHSLYCVIDDAGPALTGSRSQCVSNWGVNDMVGNVSEWVADWMQGAGKNSPGVYTWVSGQHDLPSSWGGDKVVANPSYVVPGPDVRLFPGAVSRGGNAWYGTYAGVFNFDLDSPALPFPWSGFRCAR